MATLWVATSLSPAPVADGKLRIVLQNYVGDRPLQLDTVQYKNALGQLFTVSKFRYYLGNIRLKKAGGGEVISNEYYLIDEEEPDSKKIVLAKIPAGEYIGINFIIGVDSAHNCSGAQSGTLDPVNGMFWAWNTGYIFVKLEGKAAVSKSPGHIFEFHIGGYKQPHNCIREVSLKFARPMHISGGTNNELRLKADAGELMKTPAAIDLSAMSSVTDFHNATTIADNYMDMFSILGVQ